MAPGKEREPLALAAAADETKRSKIEMAVFYNIYLKNLAKDVLKAESFVAIGHQLMLLFDAVCKHPNSTYSTSWCGFEPSKGDVKDTELLVYLLPDSSASLIAPKYPELPIDLTKNANTVWFDNSTPRISEVYLDKVIHFEDAKIQIAKLAFHELMHNKLEKFDVHGKGGDGLATGGQINSSTALTEINKELMAKALAKRVPQYQGGL